MSVSASQISPPDSINLTRDHENMCEQIIGSLIDNVLYCSSNPLQEPSPDIDLSSMENNPSQLEDGEIGDDDDGNGDKTQTTVSPANKDFYNFYGLGEESSTASTPNLSEVDELVTDQLISEKNNNVEVAAMKRDSVLVVAEKEDGEILSEELENGTKNVLDSEIEVIEIIYPSKKNENKTEKAERKTKTENTWWKCLCKIVRKVKFRKLIFPLLI